MSNTSNALAERDRKPAALIAAYSNDFATVLPSHVKPETWVRLAQGALRRNPTLEQAAAANPGSLLAALLDAARLGLEPGTEQYYLVPYKDRGRPIVQGIPGYQGEIELMYRAGAVAAVVVELVRANDQFTYRPGVDERPVHEVDWFGDRGSLVGVYAYATMDNGATSKVVVMSKAEVYEARKKSASYRSKPESSPWTTDEPAMWLKTAAHRLRKWVPTSAEYRRELARASAEAQRVTEDRPSADGEPLPLDDAIDGEVVESAGVQDPPESGSGPVPDTGSG
jgi:recombination protein RecT